MSVDLAEIFKRQGQTGGQEENLLHRATRNGAWLSAVPHRLNGTELSQEELRDNLCLRYGLIPQDIPATFPSMPYHAQRVALFWRGTMTLKRSGEPLDPGPSSLVLLPTNLKAIVGQ